MRVRLIQTNLVSAQFCVSYGQPCGQIALQLAHKPHAACEHTYAHIHTHGECLLQSDSPTCLQVRQEDYSETSFNSTACTAVSELYGRQTCQRSCRRRTAKEVCGVTERSVSRPHIQTRIITLPKPDKIHFIQNLTPPVQDYPSVFLCVFSSFIGEVNVQDTIKNYVPMEVKFTLTAGCYSPIWAPCNGLC